MVQQYDSNPAILAAREVEAPAGAACANMASASCPIASRAAALGIALAMGALYLVSPAQSPGYADDSLRWSYEITVPGLALNTHHLYLYGMRWLWQHVQMDSARLLTIYASIWGAIGLYFVHRLASLVAPCRYASLATLLCGFTVGYWSYAIVGDVYMPAMSCMVMGLYALCRAVMASTSRGATVLSVAAGAAFVGMILHHQAFFVLVMGVVPAVLIARFSTARRRLRAGLIATAVTGALTLAVYLVIYAATVPAAERPGFTKWAAGYASSYAAYPDMKGISVRNLVNMVAGQARALVATEFLFRSQTLAREIQDRFPYRHIYGHVYAVKDLSIAAMAAVVMSVVVIAVLVPLLALIGVLKSLRLRDVGAVLLVCAIPQALFFLWWEAISDEFWLWFLPVAALMVARGAMAWPRRGLPILTALVVAQIATSYFGSHRLIARSDLDIDAVNKDYLAQLQRGDLLIGMDEIVSAARADRAQQKTGFAYVNLFRAACKGRANDLDRLQKLIDTTVTAGGTVYVDPYVTQPPRSFVGLARSVKSDLPSEMRAVRAMLERVDPKRVKWMPLKASIVGFFEEPE